MKYESPNSEDEILPNKLGLTDAKDIGREEYRGFLRAEIKYESERELIKAYDWKLISEIHKISLGHLYDFAGKLRSENISKADFFFQQHNIWMLQSRSSNRIFKKQLQNKYRI